MILRSIKHHFEGGQEKGKRSLLILIKINTTDYFSSNQSYGQQLAQKESKIVDMKLIY